MDVGYIPSESDRDTIRQIVEQVKAGVFNTRNRPHAEPDQEAVQAPEVYVALTPFAGIAGLQTEYPDDAGTSTGSILQDTGTETEGEGSRVNRAVCNIYQVVSDSVKEFDLSPVGQSKDVYTICAEGVAGSTLILVARDKFGKWFNTGPGRQMLRGRMTTPIGYNSIGRMAVYAYLPGFGDAVTGESLIVWDWLLQSGQTINAGVRVVAGWDAQSKRWYLIGAQCG